MRHKHYRHHSALTFFCAVLITAALLMGGSSLARAQDAGTATPTAAGPTASETSTPAQTPTPLDTLAATAAPPISTDTIVPTETVAPSETLVPTLAPTSLETQTPKAAQPTVAAQTVKTLAPNKYFSSQLVTALDGTPLQADIINGPPAPPPGFYPQPKAAPQVQAETGGSVNILNDVPAYKWSFGCSATSGAMIAGYYDRHGYSNLYTGPTNGGVAPLDSSPWPSWTDGAGDTYAQDPLAASHAGLDGRSPATRGSIDDYWIEYGSTLADPFINHWTQHTWGNAIGDFMKTSQSSYGSTDGSTSFYNYYSSTRLTCSAMEGQTLSNGMRLSQVDGTFGRKLFYQSKGYTVPDSDCYNQPTDNQYSGGFSFAQFKAEIDAGRPVMLNLAGHTIVGTGYDSSSNTISIHDTWDYNTYTMPWGGSYYGMPLLSVSIVNPQLIPSISYFNPSSATVGNSAVNLSIFGSNFIDSSQVYWNGAALATTFVSSTQLTASVPSSNLTSAGTASVTVSNPIPGGNPSLPHSFTINNPIATLTSLDPPNILVGSNTFTLTINGSGILNSSIVKWNGVALATTFVNSTQLTASVPSSNLTSTGTVSVNVFNPLPGGGTSPLQTFTINNPLPVLTSISPTSAGIGGSDLTLTVNGSNFVSTSTVLWNNVALASTFVSSTQLSAVVPASKLTLGGAINVTVSSPTPGGGASAGSQLFTLNNPLPVISSLSPATRAAGTQAFTLSVYGSSFTPGAIVRWNGSDLATVFVTNSLLTATVPVEDLTGPGTASVTAFNPLPAGGPSAGSLSFSLTSIDPAYGAAVLNLRPTIDWPKVDSATSYNLQASVKSTLASPFLNKTISVASYTPTTDIPAKSTIYWRVRSMVNKVWGTWSEIRMFQSPNPPKAPTLSSPANGALTTNNLPRLDWSSSTLPTGITFDHYDLQITSDPAFSSGLIEPKISPALVTNSEFTLTSPLAANTRYYWRVCAYNTNGQSSSWSSVYYLRSAMLPPTLKSLSDLHAARPDFSWDQVDGASSYTFQISSGADFRKLLVNVKVAGLAYTPIVDLPKSTILYWRVQGLGTNGPSLWSETRSFTSANAPSTPKLLLPKANTLFTGSTAVLDWSDSTAPLGITVSQYEVQLTSDPTFATVDIDHNKLTQSTDQPSLSPNIKYYWRVRAYGSNDDYSAWSSVGYFRSAMLPASLSAPINGVSVTTLPTFTWGAVGGASSYTIQVSTSSTFASTTLKKTVTSPTYTAVTALPAHATLNWRVQAIGPNGPSLWSGTGSFVTP